MMMMKMIINSKIFPIVIVVLEIPYYSEPLTISLVPRNLHMCSLEQQFATFLFQDPFTLLKFD